MGVLEEQQQYWVGWGWDTWHPEEMLLQMQQGVKTTQHPQQATICTGFPIWRVREERKGRVE